MPSAIPPNPRAGAATTQNDDYDAAVDEFLKDIPLNTSTDNAAPQPAKDIDEEVVIKKKRAPVPKLDDNLLLSNNGLPKLHKITKSRLKFRGKGHEFSDISMLLNTYQLWLDDLFPRAKFRDALQIVEKVGHNKKMQVMRRAWLDGTKPYRGEEVDSGALPSNGAESEVRGQAEEDEDIFGALPTEQPNGGSRATALTVDDGPDDDDLDALLAGNEAPATTTRPVEAPKRRAPFDEESEDEDELDALLAEEASTTVPTTAARSNGEQPVGRSAEPDFADDEEAMASMDMR